MTVARVCPRWLEREQEDLAQRAMLRLLERAQRVEEKAELCASYLYRTAHNIVIDEIRKRRREVLSEDIGDQADAAASEQANGSMLVPGNPEGHVKDNQLRLALQECMAKLLAPRRLAFSLRAQGHSTKDIAKMLGWDSKKVENNIGRGRKNLQECLLNKGFGVA